MLATGKKQIYPCKALEPTRGIERLDMATASVVSLDPGAVRVLEAEKQVKGKEGSQAHSYSQGTETGGTMKSQRGLGLWGFQFDVNCAHSRMRVLDLWPRFPVHFRDLESLGQPVW